MDILDNATIVRNLSDPDMWGSVLNMAKGLIDMVEFMEEIKSIEEKHPNTSLLSDEDSYYNYIDLLESLSKQWTETLGLLNLDDLDRWIINESADIAQLEFRYKQIKCRGGNNWNKDDANTLHSEILHITARLVDIILNLKSNAFMCMYDLEAVEEDARHDAYYTVKFVSKWLRDVISIQDRFQSILSKAENILNPQPDTSTEQEQTNNILPPELATQQAMLIWSKAKINGWINDDYSFNGTKYQMAYAAECMAKSLKLKPKWRPFQILWNYKYFPQTRRESKELIGKVERDREIEASFSL